MLGLRNLSFVSNDDALLAIQRYRLEEGKAAGTQMIRVSNIAGLELHLAVDRALDIAEFRYKGLSIGYLSGTGITHPSYYEPEGYGWLRSFYGGFLTTCGLDQTGEPCKVDGVNYGLHGRISNCPAQQICTEVVRENGGLSGMVRGAVRQACQQGESYLLRRTYHFKDESASFLITDEIQNQSGRALPLQVLYHFNFGFPFLSPTTILKFPEVNSIGWDEYSQKNIDKLTDFSDSDELTILHYLNSNTDHVGGVIENHGVRVEIKLPVLGQWKHLQPREYVMAIEPTNGHLNGLAWEKSNSTLQILNPNETRTFSFEISVFDN